MRSTTTTVATPAPEPIERDDITPVETNIKTHQVFAAMVDVGKVYGDLTGRFPIQPSRGHQYILNLYDYDSNTISTQPMKNRTDKEMIRAYTSLHQQLINAGIKPELQVMDNECSSAFRQYLADEHIALQLVPPHIHRQNAAEKAIQTFKNQFVVGLCSVDKQFPMHLWCELLPQATLTLNILRTSRINPTISAATQLYGQLDFNITPLAPPGTRSVAHVKPKARRSWAPHGEDAWYVGPDPDHYRCYKVCMLATNRTRIVDIVDFFPQHVKMPHLSSQEMAIQAARKLTFALRNPAPVAPFARLGYQQHEALARLANIFKEIAAPEESGDSIPHAEAHFSIPSLLMQPHSPPPRVEALDPRVEAPAPRVDRAAKGAATPVTINLQRMLDRGVKTPTAIPPFDLYKQRRQTAQSTPHNAHSPVPQRVVTYLGETTRHLLADLQAEMGRYYNTWSRARHHTANVITTVVPPRNRDIKAEYYMHMVNEIAHAVTGETLNL
jgi:hypothetical protein